MSGLRDVFLCLLRFQEYVIARNFVLKQVTPCTGWVAKRGAKAKMLTLRAVPVLALVLAGALDCLTTVIGIACFGAVESNPFMAGIIGTSLPAFTVVKLTTTLFAGLLFNQGENLLLRAQDRSSWSFRCTHITLRIGCIAATAFLLLAVVNNLLVVAAAI